jgi:hypothetical protein
VKAIVRLTIAALIALSASSAIGQPISPREATAAEVAARTGPGYVSARRLQNAAGTLIPIGTIAPTAMDGGTWLSMNGQVVSQATYPTLFKIIGHQPEFNWTASKPFGVSSNNWGVAYGNSVYVDVLNTGGIYTSSDRINWTAQNSGVATALFSVCWDSDNSLFIAVGSSNVILTSPDGVTWTPRTSGVTSSLTRVVHAAGRTVAVGSSGWITYSTNDTSWTAVQPNSGPTYSWVVYNHSVWFLAPAGTNGNGIAYSTDGTTWNFVTKPTTNSCNFDGTDGTYFYLGATDTGEILRSTNGASWASVNTSLNWQTGSSGCTPVFFSNGTIAMLGGFNIGSTGYTTDGFASLHRLIATPISKVPDSTGVISNPFGGMTAQKFAIGSVQGGTTASNYIPSYSVDGKTWHTEPFSPGFFQGLPTNIEFWNGYHFILVGGGGNGAQVISAPEPYAPATQFQIPTRTDPTGTALLIKAL